MRYILLIGIILFALINYKCTSNKEVLTKDISEDNIYISKHINWKEPDISIKALADGQKSIIGIADVELIILQNNTFIFIQTSSMKMANDSIQLFWPPENGGVIYKGIISEKFQVESKATEINKMKVIRTDTNSIVFKESKFNKLANSNIKWIVEVISKHSNFNLNDTGVIEFARP